VKDLKTTNTLLLFIVVPVVLYILKILSFIFIPLVFSMLIALMFSPIMRWLKNKKVPKFINILIVISLIIGFLKGGIELIQLTGKEILSADAELFNKAESKLIAIIILIEDFFGIERIEGENVLVHYFKDSNLIQNFDSTFDFVGNTISMTLMTIFFTVLWLSESINFQYLLNTTIFKQKYSSIKVFIRIEKDLIKFIIVKFIISFLTGLGFTIFCLVFDISFPIFWGLFAFAINFLQMIGSFISVILLSLFAFVELDQTGTLLLFILAITFVQILMGGVLEPIFMGKSFSINVITILVMLMFWGFLWGVPGLIMSIPITVFLKIIFEQFPRTRIISNLMEGTDKKRLLNFR
jgi:AI-2 transport protein TqsA